MVVLLWPVDAAKGNKARPVCATTGAVFSITMGYGFPKSAVFLGGGALRQPD
jgi:hypothetical protein